MKKITKLTILFTIILLGVSSCAPSVSQEDIDKLKGGLSATQSELQVKMAEAEKLKTEKEALQNQYDGIKSELESMQEQFDSAKSEKDESQTIEETLQKQLNVAESKYNTLNADYGKLNLEYQDLKAKYDAIAGAPMMTINEQDVEQQIFQLVNEERINNGLNELEWGVNLYKTVQANSKNMAAKQELVYADYGAFQELFRAAGYDAVEKLSEAAMTIWKTGNQYDRKFLNSGTLYGAVGVYKSGEIYYITYIADYFR